MSKASQVREGLLASKERMVYRDGAFHRCEGQAFKSHVCREPLEMNEVLITRRIFQKLPPAVQDYFFDAVNCSMNCRWFHRNYGHTRDYRQWFRIRMEEIYGGVRVRGWLMNAPLKVRQL